MAASYIFISYARKQRSQVKALADTLQQLGHHVWFDESLSGGAKWWAEILNQIEQCHVFLYVLSMASLNSEACAAEKQYAQELGKPLLPVKVESVGSARLPADLAQLQTIDYTDSSREELIRLVNAIQNMPEPEPLPSPPPEKPPVPVSYLSQLGRQARSAATSDEQILVIYRLGVIVESDEDPDKRAEALAIIDDMARRHDLFAEAERQIRMVKERTRAQQQKPPEPPEQPKPSPQQPPQPEPPREPAAQSTAPETAPRRDTVPSGPPPTPVARNLAPPPPPPQALSAPRRERPQWLLPVVVGGGVILIALIALCFVWLLQS